MPRTVKEWIGRTPDTKIPDRVWIRVIERSGWRCSRCRRAVDRMQVDHRIAVINGGENREINLQALCKECHVKKTARDLKLKAKTYRIHKRRAGIPKKKGRSFPTNKSGPFKRKIDGTVVRR